ncbi:hypothetical protein [Ruania albidiflava]|uniref:hypothetical protein n=1 Tax=Ruania albidiflava TaxID=366586 RepID=UPI0023F07337|nr:hypothetical protein [Ruania albidiflava]
MSAIKKKMAAGMAGSMLVVTAGLVAGLPASADDTGVDPAEAETEVGAQEADIWPFTMGHAVYGETSPENPASVEQGEEVEVDFTMENNGTVGLDHLTFGLPSGHVTIERDGEVILDESFDVLPEGTPLSEQKLSVGDSLTSTYGPLPTDEAGDYELELRVDAVASYPDGGDPIAFYEVSPDWTDNWYWTVEEEAESGDDTSTGGETVPEDGDEAPGDENGDEGGTDGEQGSGEPGGEPGGTAPGTDEPVEEEEPAEDGAQDDTDEEEGEDEEQKALESLLTALLSAVTALLAYFGLVG